ncbi:hypothetical protein AGLY_014058, partial [Aphis glycines]
MCLFGAPLYIIQGLPRYLQVPDGQQHLHPLLPTHCVICAIPCVNYMTIIFYRVADRGTRAMMLLIARCTHIRWVFEYFVDNCKKAYTISEYVTIDERLQAFRGHCSFKMYIPNKPAKYGIKIFALVDAISYYKRNLEIYAGVQPDGPFKLDNSAASVVKRLVEPIRNTGRNITTDNWFTSVPLAIDLFKNYKLTLVGTICKNKRELPIELIATKNRPIYSSYFGFSEKKVTIVSYTPKKNKVVLMLSTMHHDSLIDKNTNELKKPEIITFYNATKGAVDTMDKKSENYTVARKCCRWPLSVFYSILNIAELNLQVIFQENIQIKMSRLNFFKNLSRQLMEDQLKYRMTKDMLPKTIKYKIMQYCNTLYRETSGIDQRVRAFGRCAFCEQSKDRKTTKVCTNCAKLICRDHLIETCPDCFMPSADIVLISNLSVDTIMEVASKLDNSGIATPLDEWMVSLSFLVEDGTKWD